MRSVYLDWNSTTPLHEDALLAMNRAARDAWGNPSSLHQTGRAAKAAVEQAREDVAALAGYSPRDLVFTSGGTEANNLALLRPFWAADGNLIAGTCVTSRLEHPSVTQVAEMLARRGVNVLWLPVPPSGRIDPEDVDRALSSARSGPRLVALQAVNHETGVLQPITEVATVALKHGAELHVDAVQAVGKLAPDIWRPADSIAVAAHKLRGPKGIGAWLGRPGLVVRPILRGGAQERGLRPGTVDPVAAAGFGAAALRAHPSHARYEGLRPLRDRLEGALLALGGDRSPRAQVNGAAERAPHVCNLSFAGWSGDELVAAIDLEGVCTSAGSACAAGTPEPSRVIAVMLGEERARSALRLSLGEDTTEDDVDWAIATFERVLAR